MPIQRAISFLSSEINFCGRNSNRNRNIKIYLKKKTFRYGSQKKLEDNFQWNLLPTNAFL